MTQQPPMTKELNALLGLDPQFPEPGVNSWPDDPDLRPVNYFTERDVTFLREFAKTLDVKMAADALGITYNQANRMCQRRSMKDEIHAIYDAWKKAIRMTAEHSAGRFLTILDKVEGAFDGADQENQGRLSSALAKLASDYLKATGHFDKSNANKTAPPMQFNIHIGGEVKKVKAVKEENQQTVEVQCE